MKRPANYANDVSDTLVRGANEARDLLNQTASTIESEWKRLIESVDQSSSLPPQVKTAVNRFDGTVGEVRQFVESNAPKVVTEGARVARRMGVPIPEDWSGPEADVADDVAEDAADAADDVADDVADAELVDDVVASVADDATADSVADVADQAADATADSVADVADQAADATADSVADVADQAADQVADAADGAHDAGQDDEVAG